MNGTSTNSLPDYSSTSGGHFYGFGTGAHAGSVLLELSAAMVACAILTAS